LLMRGWGLEDSAQHECLKALGLRCLWLSSTHKQTSRQEQKMRKKEATHFSFDWSLAVVGVLA
jgi:hypothetical protein